MTGGAHGRTLGVHIVGPNASELIAASTLAMRLEATVAGSRRDDPRAPDARRDAARSRARLRGHRDPHRGAVATPDEDPWAQLGTASPGDLLLFSRPQGGLGVVISLLTRSPYYHVAIVEKETFTIEARQRGVVRRDLRTKEGGHFWTVIPAPNGCGPKALDWARSQVGDKFDRFDFFVILLDRIVSRLHIRYEPGGKYSCGEFVARAFREAGCVLFPDIQDADVEPADFARLLTKK